MGFVQRFFVRPAAGAAAMHGCACLIDRLEDRRLLSGVATFSAPHADAPAQPIRPGEFILGVSAKASGVKGYGAAAGADKLQRMLDKRGGGARVTRQLGRPSQYLLELPDTSASDKLLRAARRLPGFRYLQPNRVASLDRTPNDESFEETYGLHNTGQFWFGLSKPDADIDAPEAWDVTTGSGDVVVGVIDTGVDYTHPDLAANMWTNPGEVPGDNVDNDGNGYVDDVHGIDAANDDSDPMDDQDHGTHCAGTIGAVGDNGIGVAGVNWRVKIMALKFLTAEGTGSYADAVECLNYATMMRQRGVNIRLTSNSWGGDEDDPAMKEAIDASERAGLLFVAAAGNQGVDNDGILRHYPAGFDNPSIVAVAATDCWDSMPYWSNYGATTVDLAAPGVDVLSTVRDGGYEQFSGTSMATPHVAGVAALAWSVKPDATWQEIRDALVSSTDPLPALAGKVATGGRLNALGALRALAGGSPNSISGTVFIDSDHNGRQEPNEAPLPGTTVFLDADDDGVLDGAERDYDAEDVPVAIPEVGKVTSRLTVAGVTGSVLDVDVTLDVAHTYQSDLHAYLVSPAGTRVKLFSAVGTSEDDFAGTTLDDEATTPVGDGTGRFTGRFKPQGNLSDFDGSDPNGTWTLEIEDTEFNDEGTLNRWSVRLSTGERSVVVGAAGAYAFEGLAPGPHVVRQVTPAGHTQTAPVSGAHRVDLSAGQAVGGRDFGNYPGTPPPRASVVGRHVFYNGSAYDGGDPWADGRDDAAIAPDKAALLPGRRASSANITGYSRGINGVMVDVRGLPQDVTLTAGDFTFAFGNDDRPGDWDGAARPDAVTVRRGAGAEGSDRVTLAWSGTGVRNGWLRVTVLPTPATGLNAPDTFFFGNLAGFTGRAGDPIVRALDFSATRRAAGLVGKPAGLSSAYDHDRNGRVDSADALVTRGNLYRRINLIEPREGAAPVEIV